MIDSHCHLNLLEGDISIADALQQARAAGVRGFLNVSVDLDQLPELLAVVEQEKDVWASAGIHPNTVLSTPMEEADLLHAADHPGVIAIGETGLDNFRNKVSATEQQQRFVQHIAVAKKCRKPLIIHTREAKQKTLDLLRDEAADEVGGIMHCFVEDWHTAQAAMALNFVISFSGIVTFRNAKDLHEVARQVPLDQLLIETDSPWLAPVPHRGKPNQPAYVRHVAEQIASLKGISVETVIMASTENFQRIFPQTAPK